MTSECIIYQAIVYVENLEDYKPGGLHPVHIRDTLSNGRYTILNKIDHGDFSTVWLAQDATRDRCVAIKILCADDSRADKSGVEKLKHLKSGDLWHPGRTRVVLPLDEFETEGPSGLHLRIVTPVLGKSLAWATKRWPDTFSEVLPLDSAKAGAYNLVMGVAYLHKMKICHSDHHPQNLLLGFPSADGLTVKEMLSMFTPPRLSPVVRLDGKPLSDHVPRYAVSAAFAKALDPSLFSGQLAIADLQNCFSTDHPPPVLDVNGPYLVPEAYSSGHITLAADIFLLGCAIFHLLSGRDLFGMKDWLPHQVINAMSDALGAPPAYILEAWKSRIAPESRNVIETPSRTIRSRVEEIRSGNVREAVSDRSSEFSVTDIEILVDLLSRMVVYEPQDRLSIADVFKHPAIAYFKDRRALRMS